MKSSDKKLIAAANLVEATGAEICIDNCRYRLTPQDLVLYTKDHEAFYAKHHGLTIAQWRAWVDHRDTWQCTATTKRGKRCENQTDGVSEPEKFIPGKTDKCRIHSATTNA